MVRSESQRKQFATGKTKVVVDFVQLCDANAKNYDQCCFFDLFDLAFCSMSARALRSALLCPFLIDSRSKGYGEDVK